MLGKHDVISRLTPRELEIGQLAAVGLASKSIAARLSLSVRTVNNHLGRIYRKLGISGRAELAVVIDRSRLPIE